MSNARQHTNARTPKLMSASLIAALFFTVALLVITAYFLMGSVPLLILKHDTSLDSRFVRGFFNTYYLAAMFAASATAVSYAVAGKLIFAAGAGRPRAVGRDLAPERHSKDGLASGPDSDERDRCHHGVPTHTRDCSTDQPGPACTHLLESHDLIAVTSLLPMMLTREQPKRGRTPRTEDQPCPPKP